MSPAHYVYLERNVMISLPDMPKTELEVPQLAAATMSACQTPVKLNVNNKKVQNSHQCKGL